MRAVVENRVVKSTVQYRLYPEVDVGRFLQEACSKFADRTALIDDSAGTCYTYKELGELISRVAAGLCARGFRLGHVAGLHCRNNPEMLFAFYGVVLAGGSVVLAKHDLTERELEHQFRGTSPTIVFCDEKNAKKTLRACKTILSVKTLVVFGNHEGLLPMSSLLCTSLDEFTPPAVLDLDTTAAIFYSSGTSGHPKPILISHRNIVAQSVISTSGGRYIEADDIMLGNMTFTHVSGVWYFGAAFTVGAAVVLIAVPELSNVLSAIERHKVSIH